MQQLDVLCAKLDSKPANAGHVSFRAVKAGHKPRSHRIDAAGKDDWDGRSQFLGNECRIIAASCHNDRNLTSNEVRGQHPQPVGVVLRKTVFDRDVLTLDVTGLGEAVRAMICASAYCNSARD